MILEEETCRDDENIATIEEGVACNSVNNYRSISKTKTSTLRFNPFQTTTVIISCAWDSSSGPS